MTVSVDLFRKLSLSLPGAVEGSHLGHADFRLNNRIFATLAMQAQGFGVLKITPEQQAAFIAERPNIYLLTSTWWLGPNGNDAGASGKG